MRLNQNACNQIRRTASETVKDRKEARKEELKTSHSEKRKARTVELRGRTATETTRKLRPKTTRAECRSS